MRGRTCASWMLFLQAAVYFVIITAQDEQQLPPPSRPLNTETSCHHSDNERVCKQPTADDTQQQQQPPPPSPRNISLCTLYLAPSTIPNAGLGVFTASPLSPGEILNVGDVVISLREIMNHPRSGLTKFDKNPLENYSWNLRTVLLNLGYQNPFTDMTASSAAFVPGLQSLINSNIVLLNVAQQQAKSTMTDVRDPSTMVHGSTPYQNLSTMVTHSIPAGGELFTYYGDDWFLERAATVFQRVPLSVDVPLAEDMLHEIGAVIAFIDSDSALRQYWNQMLTPFPLVRRERLKNILPYTVDDLQVALDSGLRAMHQRYAIRSLEDLQENGACLDRIVPKPSTVPGSGMGGFAAMSIPNGSIITTSPLLYFSNYQESLDHQIWNNVTKMYETKKPYHRKSLPLLLNYCWGHDESTILLCPYGTGVAYINHAPKAAQVNIEIRWSNRTFFPPIDKEWIETDPLLWKKNATTSRTEFSAFVDYVAIKDIQLGEELFVDYGHKWEKAWNTFLLTQQHKIKHSPEAAKLLNLKQAVLRTEEEQDDQPYPADVLLRCHEAVFQSQILDISTVTELWESNSHSKIQGLPCQVLERHVNLDTQQTTYAVRVVRPGPPSNPQLWVGLAGIPRAYISFFDECADNEHEYFQQMLASTSFQHAMQLPHSLLPAVWRNLNP